jgi:inosine-uridine nucleoside N-ribohydrolase
MVMIHIKKIILPLLLLSSLIAKQSSADSRVCCLPPTAPNPTIPVVLFADLTNFDDTFGLVLLLKDTRVDLKAIYIVGNAFSSAGATIQYVLNICDWMGRTNVPVVIGSCYATIDANAPAGGPRDETWQAAVPKGSNGLFLQDSLYGLQHLLPQSPRHYVPVTAASSGYEDDIAAINIIRAVIAESDTPVNILALGPVTGPSNVLLGATFPAFPAPIVIAPADASVLSNIASYVQMGGSLNANPGNVLFFFDEICNSEFNIWCDPEAAQNVFTLLAANNIPMTLVPLDATNTVPALPFIQLINQTEPQTPEFAFLRNLANETARSWFSYPDLTDLYIWDMTAVMAFLDPSVIAAQGVQNITVIVDTTLDKQVVGSNCSAFDPANTCPLSTPCDITITRTYTGNTGRTIAGGLNPMNVITAFNAAQLDQAVVTRLNTKNQNSARVPLLEPIGLYKYRTATVTTLPV